MKRIGLKDAVARKREVLTDKPHIVRCVSATTHSNKRDRWQWECDLDFAGVTPAQTKLLAAKQLLVELQVGQRAVNVEDEEAMRKAFPRKLDVAKFLVEERRRITSPRETAIRSMMKATGKSRATCEAAYDALTGASEPEVEQEAAE